MSDINVLVVFYSRYGNAERIALAAGVGAIQARANIRLRRVADHADAKTIDATPAWRENLDRMNRDYVAPRPADPQWADVIVLATPPESCAEIESYCALLPSIGSMRGKIAAPLAPRDEESVLKPIYAAAACAGMVVVPAKMESGDPITAARETETSYNANTNRGTYTPAGTPAPSTYMIATDDEWFLNLHDQVKTTQGTASAVTQLCFDRTTGFLNRRRVLSGTEQGTKDLLTVLTSSAGNVDSEALYGGDVAPLNIRFESRLNRRGCSGELIRALPTGFDRGRGRELGLERSVTGDPGKIACASCVFPRAFHHDFTANDRDVALEGAIVLARRAMVVQKISSLSPLRPLHVGGSAIGDL